MHAPGKAQGGAGSWATISSDLWVEWGRVSGRCGVEQTDLTQLMQLQNWPCRVGGGAFNIGKMEPVLDCLAGGPTMEGW